MNRGIDAPKGGTASAAPRQAAPRQVAPRQAGSFRPDEVDITDLQALLDRYPASGPRYTSYPTAADFSTAFDGADLDSSIARSNSVNHAQGDAGDLSVYLHMPFCEHLCFYCGCNKVLTRNRAKGVEYLDYLFREMDLWHGRLTGERTVRQFHLGGGTPTFFTLEQIRRVMEQLGRCFSLASDPQRDYSIEIDPRTVDSTYVAALVEAGFNRLSIGVQDFDPDVQAAVHRRQDADRVAEIVDTARARGAGSINFDLIYGLPRQSVSSFRRTLQRVIDCLPDRLSIYQYAHLPERFPAQRRILTEELPGVETRLALQQLTMDTLAGAGYVHIGMDHFALPGDPLVRGDAWRVPEAQFPGIYHARRLRTAGHGGQFNRRSGRLSLPEPERSGCLLHRHRQRAARRRPGHRPVS